MQILSILFVLKYIFYLFVFSDLRFMFQSTQIESYREQGVDAGAGHRGYGR